MKDGDGDGDPFHPILERPWTWELTEFTYRRDAADWMESYIDLVFERAGVVRRLRFFGPQDFRLGRGLPHSMGLCITDVSGRQLENIRVRVVNFEPMDGVPEFWAARVEEVETDGPYGVGSSSQN